jgi:hypothetical protein
MGDLHKYQTKELLNKVLNTGETAIKVETGGASITGIANGRKTVTVAATAETLAGATTCQRVDITAETDNTGIIVVGGSTCVALLATRQGTPLSAGDSYSIDIDDLSDVYIDATVSGDGVSFTYFT